MAMPTAATTKMLTAAAPRAEGRESGADSFRRRVADRLVVTTCRLFLRVRKDSETFTRCAAPVFVASAVHVQLHCRAVAEGDWSTALDGGPGRSENKTT